jgi:hypothetical protein
VEIDFQPDGDISDVEIEYQQKDMETVPDIEDIELEYEPLTIEEGEVTGGRIERATKAFQQEKRKRTLEAKRRADIITEPEIEELRELEQAHPTGAELFGKILADITQAVEPKALASLSRKQLEDLAVKFEAQDRMGFFGAGANPYKKELFNRIKAQERLKLERARLEAELEPTRERIREEMKRIQMRASGERPQSGAGGDPLGLRSYWDEVLKP